jgi:hypothetical protein
MSEREPDPDIALVDVADEMGCMDGYIEPDVRPGLVLRSGGPTEFISVSTCDMCGLIVYDTDTHLEWHRRVTGALRVLQAMMCAFQAMAGGES